MLRQIQILTKFKTKFIKFIFKNSYYRHVHSGTGHENSNIATREPRRGPGIWPRHVWNPPGLDMGNYPVWRVNVTPRQREQSLPLREATWSTNVRRRWHTCQQVVSHTRSNNKADLAQATKVLVPLAIAGIHTIQDPSTVIQARSKVPKSYYDPGPRGSFAEKRRSDDPCMDHRSLQCLTVVRAAAGTTEHWSWTR